VNLLLDTHVFLWLQTAPERLGPQLRLVQGAATGLLVSAASSWEIAIKYRLGRLPLPEPPEHDVPSRLRAVGAEPLAIEHAPALALSLLPPPHRDPFDRLLIAQARHLGIPIMTADQQITQYPVAVIDLMRNA
jgi:PIN domain nuclease of toxin-antitoxin system